MSRLVIFAGTTEGRRLARILHDNKISCDVCVATEYGSQLIKSTEYITVHEGRLDEEGMTRLFKEAGAETVIDATHPYAKVVTKTIKKSIEGTSLKYIRLRRPENGCLEACDRVYKDTSECVEGLLNTTGKILLTTGSKELKAFSESELKDRLVVRVLPGMESINLCYEAGLLGKQIIAMQGPFSEAMNEATFRQYQIEHLVTKESGAAGGFDEKVSAAIKSGVTVHVIERPDKGESDEKSGHSLMEVLDILNENYGYKLTKPKVNVALVGIGTGNESLLTVKARECVAGASYVFGAKRMLELVNTNAPAYPFYLKEDIIPKLSEIYETGEGVSVAILFSGDTGFYSGATKIHEALKFDARFNVTIEPGISSVSLLSARTGIDWGTSKVLSLHGKDIANSLSMLKGAVIRSKNTFLITSGASDIRAIGEAYRDNSDIKIYVGYNLSYPDERVMCLSPEECSDVNEEGLYACVIVNDKPLKPLLVPCMKDDEFIREKVPMTKEAVRELSLCRLKLREGDVVYDIGSGTGSIAVQVASMSETLKVYALECNDEALALMDANVSKFGLANVEIIKAMAPEGLMELPEADCAFIGGTKGHLKEILDTLYKINSSMRIVINAVSLESITEIYSIINNYSVTDVDITQAQISTAKKLGEYNLMQAANPVFIFSFAFL